MRVTWQTLISMMIVLLMSVFFFFPSGVHLEICFGFDGHIGVAPDACTTTPAGQLQQQVENVNTHHHHGKCLDIIIGCTSLDILVCTAEKGGSFKSNTARNGLFKIVGCDISAFQPIRLQDHSTFLDNIGTLSPPLLSHQTVVLLI